MDYYLLLILLCNSCGQSLKFLFTVVVQIRVCLENGVKFHELKSFAKTVFQLNQSPRTVLEEQSPVTRRFGFSFCFSCFQFTQRWLRGWLSKVLLLMFWILLEFSFFADRNLFFFHDGPYKKCSPRHFSALPFPREMNERE